MPYTQSIVATYNPIKGRCDYTRPAPSADVIGLTCVLAVIATMVVIMMLSMSPREWSIMWRLLSSAVSGIATVSGWCIVIALPTFAVGAVISELRHVRLTDAILPRRVPIRRNGWDHDAIIARRAAAFPEPSQRGITVSDQSCTDQSIINARIAAVEAWERAHAERLGVECPNTVTPVVAICEMETSINGLPTDATVRPVVIVRREDSPSNVSPDALPGVVVETVVPCNDSRNVPTDAQMAAMADEMDAQLAADLAAICARFDAAEEAATLAQHDAEVAGMAIAEPLTDVPDTSASETVPTADSASTPLESPPTQSVDHVNPYSSLSGKELASLCVERGLASSRTTKAGYIARLKRADSKQ